MVSLTDKILFHPGTNRVLATMDDSRSSIALATTDFVGSSGRTYMEYKRDTHGGRERLCEEFLTWIIWGFGIKTAKTIYDKAMTTVPALKKLNIDFPSMDVDLLPAAPGQAVETGVKNPKWNQHFGAWLKSKVFPEVTQSLNKEKVEEFVRAAKGTPFEKEYGSLLKVVSKPELFNQKYYLSNLTKFSIATMAPVLLIAFGIPTLNQMITRKKFEAKNAKQNPPNATHPGKLHHHANAFGGFPYRAMQQPVPSFAPAFSNPAMAFNMPPAYATGGFGFPQAGAPVPPYGLPMPSQTQWPQRFGQRSAQAQPHKKGKQTVQFGNLGGMVQKLASGSSLFLQNDQLNTLLVDNTITAGRLYKGRNTLERLEILFREASIITFLYFARKPIQDLIGNLVGKIVSGKEKIPVEMEFKTIKSLVDHSETNKGFFKRFKKDLAALVENPGQLKNAADLQFKSDTAIVDAIRHEFLKQGTGKATRNSIFEIAKKVGWIPTLDDKQMFLNLTQKVDVDSLKTMVKSVAELSVKANNNPAKFEALLKKAMKIRAGAWVLSNVVCFVYLSLLVPKIQHMITRWKTGKDMFPGTQGYDAQTAQ